MTAGYGEIASAIDRGVYGAYAICAERDGGVTLTMHLGQIEEHLAMIDAAIADLIAGDPNLSERLSIPVSIPGIAAVTAAMLVTEMPEL